MNATNNRVTGPLDTAIPTFVFQGMALPIIADMVDGGFLQVVNGTSPLAQAVPGIQVPKGAMLALIVPEYAEKIRPGLRQMENQLKGAGPPV